MKKKALLFISGILLLIGGCSKSDTEDAITPPNPDPITDDGLTTTNVRSKMADPNATAETVALFYNLKKLSGAKFAIGQQDAFNAFYNNVSGMSDIKKTTGNDPALLG